MVGFGGDGAKKFHLAVNLPCALGLIGHYTQHLRTPTHRGGAFETKAVTDLDLQKRLVGDLHLELEV